MFLLGFTDTNANYLGQAFRESNYMVEKYLKCFIVTFLVKPASVFFNRNRVMEDARNFCSKTTNDRVIVPIELSYKKVNL